MATYLVLNCAVLAAVILVFGIRPRRPSSLVLSIAGVLLLLTVIFDSLLISVGIVAYDPGKLLGIYLGRAPIEDFFYTLLAVLIVPTLWNKTHRQSVSSSAKHTERKEL